MQNNVYYNNQNQQQASGVSYQPQASSYQQPNYYNQQQFVMNQPGFPQQQAYVAPPVEYGAYQQQYAYNYNPNNIQYTYMTVDDWSKVSNDPSPYSQNWTGSDAFSPETVSENMQKDDKCRDIGWAIAFWINFCISIGLFIWLLYEGIDKVFTNEEETGTVETNMDWGYLGKCLGWGFCVALVVNIIHAVYACCAPVFYIKFGLLVGFILSLIFGIWAIIYCDILFVIFPIIFWKF